MSELSPESRALLASLADAYEPPPEAAPRVRAAVAARLAAPPPALRWPWAAGVCVVTALVVGVLARPSPAPAPRPVAPPAQAAAPAPPPAPEVIAPPAPPSAPVTAPVVAPAPAPAPAVVPPPARAARVRAAPPEAADDLMGELAWIQRAQRSLSRGDGAGALAALAEHARRYPRGRLREEREAAQALALCAAGRGDEARAAADRFVAAHPASPQVARVRGACR
ncbi:MAG: hypothetical protein R3A48_08050 [Polyangiales bacterium]